MKDNSHRFCVAVVVVPLGTFVVEGMLASVDSLSETAAQQERDLDSLRRYTVRITIVLVSKCNLAVEHDGFRQRTPTLPCDGGFPIGM